MAVKHTHSIERGFKIDTVAGFCKKQIRKYFNFVVLDVIERMRRCVCFYSIRVSALRSDAGLIGILQNLN